MHLQALDLSRGVLGDKAEETQQCLQTVMGLRGKMRAMQEAIEAGSR